MMLASRGLIRGWSHGDAHLAHVETRFAAARRGVGRSATSRGRTVSRGWSHCDTVDVAL